MVPRADVIPLAMSVDEALKYVISMGVVAPPLRGGSSRRRRCRCEIRPAERPASAQPDGRAAPAAPAPRHLSAATREPSRSARDPKRSILESKAMRTTYCGLVSEALLGQTVTLMGWAHRRRDHGGVIFIDLRDREGLVQVVCDPDRAAMFARRRGRAQRVLPEGHRHGARRARPAPRTPT